MSWPSVRNDLVLGPHVLVVGPNVLVVGPNVLVVGPHVLALGPNVPVLSSECPVCPLFCLVLKNFRKSRLATSPSVNKLLCRSGYIRGRAVKKERLRDGGKK